MSVSINPSLMQALHRDDVEQFRSTMEEVSGHWQWPRDSPTSDYELLMKAIKLGRKRIANLLLDKGAKVFKNGCKTTPLHQAVMLVGWGSVVERLLALGAKVSIQNTRGDTVLHQAFRCGAPYPVMEMLLKAYTKESRMDEKNKDGLTFLHIASTRDKTKYLQEYLDAYGTDIDAQVSLTSGSTYAGYTALHFAVAYGRYENVEILLKNNADIHFQDVNGSTPLHFALERHNSWIIDLLLKYDKTNKNVVNTMGLSHFMAACGGSDSNVVEQFLNVAQTTGCNSYLTLIQSRTKDDVSYPLGGYTALHIAAEFGQAHILHGLIAIGADSCALTTSGMTPYMLAAMRQHVYVCFVMHQICEYACGETYLFADTGVDDVNSMNVAGKNPMDVNGYGSLSDLSNGQLSDDASNGIQIYDYDELSLVLRRGCHVDNPVLSSTLSKLDLEFELSNI